MGETPSFSSYNTIAILRKEVASISAERPGRIINDLNYLYNNHPVSHQIIFPFCILTGNIPDCLYDPRDYNLICDVRSYYAPKDIKSRFDNWAGKIAEKYL